jgi:hypothetical protein
MTGFRKRSIDGAPRAAAGTACAAPEYPSGITTRTKYDAAAALSGAGCVSPSYQKRIFSNGLPRGPGTIGSRPAM